MTNLHASPKVRTFPADTENRWAHERFMARRGVPKGPVNWYLREWMAACGLDGRGSQAKMMEMTGWSKATMSQLFNGTQDYSPKVVNDAARALNAEPWELLMHPDQAMALRRLQTSASDVVRIAHDAGLDTPTRDGTHG
jgi:transcriptional regulator with XRE-family HTH domain